MWYSISISIAASQVALDSRSTIAERAVINLKTDLALTHSWSSRENRMSYPFLRSSCLAFPFAILGVALCRCDYCIAASEDAVCRMQRPGSTLYSPCQLRCSHLLQCTKCIQHTAISPFSRFVINCQPVAALKITKRPMHQWRVPSELPCPSLLRLHLLRYRPCRGLEIQTLHRIFRSEIQPRSLNLALEGIVRNCSVKIKLASCHGSRVST